MQVRASWWRGRLDTFVRGRACLALHALGLRPLALHLGLHYPRTLLVLRRGGTQRHEVRGQLVSVESEAAR